MSGRRSVLLHPSLDSSLSSGSSSELYQLPADRKKVTFEKVIADKLWNLHLLLTAFAIKLTTNLYANIKKKQKTKQEDRNKKKKTKKKNMKSGIQ